MLWQKALSTQSQRGSAVGGSNASNDHAQPRNSSWKRQRPLGFDQKLLLEGSSTAHSNESMACSEDEGEVGKGTWSSDDERCGGALALRPGGFERGRRLWDASVVYPMGVSNWADAKNCRAALHYDCPCGRQCLSTAGDVINIYEHRRKIRALAEQKSSGGFRDTIRRLLSEHFDAQTSTFTRSFVVGKCGHACEYAFAIGSSCSEVTFVRARTDVVQNRGWHDERLTVKHAAQSIDRRQLDG